MSEDELDKRAEKIRKFILDRIKPKQSIGFSWSSKLKGKMTDTGGFYDDSRSDEDEIFLSNDNFKTYGLSISGGIVRYKHIRRFNDHKGNIYQFDAEGNLVQ